MIAPFFILVTSFLVTFLMFPVFIQFLRRRHFMDDPGGRKIHTVQTPAMGGFPIFLAFTFAVLIWTPFEVLKEIKYILSAFSLIFIVGFRDDLINLKALQKLLGQVAAALIIVVVCDIRLNSFYMLGWGDFPLALSYILSIFTIIVITNAFNLIDGIDGLSGVVGILVSLFFGIWFYLNGELGMAFIALAFSGSLMAFLNFNWAPSKIFMGDTGSLLIGFYLSVAAIKFIDLNHSLNSGEVDSTVTTFSASIGTAIAVLIIPLADTLRVFIKRALKGKSPMHPDRTHVHHILLRLGCNHAQATSILGTVNLIFVLLALVFQNLGDAIVIPAVILTALALSTILDFIFLSAIERRKEELRAARQKEKRETRVVRLPKVGGEG